MCGTQTRAKRLPVASHLLRRSVARLKKADCRFRIRHTECAGYLQARQLRLPLVALLLALGGCAPYRFGVRSLYPQDIETVHVPMFECDSFRRNLGEQLTEAVCKEIEATTPYKVVNSSDADSVLLGRLGPDTKKVLVETGTDEPRQLQINYTVQIRWLTRDQQVLQERSINLPADLVTIGQATDYVPEVGQTYATQSTDAIQRLARQIVHLMEAPW